MDDVVENKIAIIKKCLRRIREEYKGHETEFDSNYTKQDSIILNLQRASEAALDVSGRIVAMLDLGVPQNSRDVFIMIEKEGYIPEDLSKKLQAMVGFRNIAVHDYQKVNLEIVKSIITHQLPDFEKFIEAIRQAKYSPS